MQESAGLTPTERTSSNSPNREPASLFGKFLNYLIKKPFKYKWLRIGLGFAFKIASHHGGVLNLAIRRKLT